MSKEGAAKQDKVGGEVEKTGVQEYIDRLNKVELIQRLSLSELKTSIEYTNKVLD